MRSAPTVVSVRLLACNLVNVYILEKPPVRTVTNVSAFLPISFLGCCPLLFILAVQQYCSLQLFLGNLTGQEGCLVHRSGRQVFLACVPGLPYILPFEFSCTRKEQVVAKWCTTEHFWCDATRKDCSCSSVVDWGLRGLVASPVFLSRKGIPIGHKCPSLPYLGLLGWGTPTSLPHLQS